MKTKFLVGFLLSCVLLVQQSLPLMALSLKMQPLIYNDTLKKGEKKKGFVDISNPTSSTIKLRTSVQAFRQVDDKGSLQFYDSPQVSAGLIPDLTEFELASHEVMRMYFLIDGTKLPSGDVFAGLFVSTANIKQQKGVNGSVRLGTLFTLVNGTPGPRNAQITKLDVTFWQLSTTIHGSYQIKNTAKVGEATGFFPSVALTIDPWHSQQQLASSLVFAGRTRENNFQANVNRLGFYKIAVAYGDSKQEKWVFMATGYWIAVLSGVIVAVLLLTAWWVRRVRRHRKPQFRRG